MAAIDKTYVDKTQLLEAIDWAKDVGTVTLENGYKFKPINWIMGYNDLENLPDLDEYILWNTPVWFDRWLWNNCPLYFVKDRIKEVYSEDFLTKFETWEYIEPTSQKTKYTFLKKPCGHWKCLLNLSRGRGRLPGRKGDYVVCVKYPIEGNICGLRYDKQTDSWSEPYGMLPCYDNYVWLEHHKNAPTEKSIIRQLRKWKLPKGAIVTVESMRYYLDFEILIK